MVTHDPAAAAYADRVLFLADGQIVDELRDPTADTVLDRMKSLEPADVTSRWCMMLRATLKSLLARKLRLVLSGAGRRARRHVRGRARSCSPTRWAALRRPVRRGDQNVAVDVRGAEATPAPATSDGERPPRRPGRGRWTRGRAPCRASQGDRSVDADGARVVGSNGKVRHHVRPAAPRRRTGLGEARPAASSSRASAPAGRRRDRGQRPAGQERPAVKVGDRVGAPADRQPKEDLHAWSASSATAATRLPRRRAWRSPSPTRSRSS